VRADGVSRSPAAYGTEVHARLAAEINGPRGYDDPVNVNFRAEVSILKSNLDDYGTRGSVRVDVLERVDTNTVCVYDIKTGRARLSRPRIDEIAFNVNRLYPGTSRLLIIETRPR
jgi:hypothetical protein